MLRNESSQLALIENDTTINSFPDGHGDDSGGEDTDSDTKPDGGDQ